MHQEPERLNARLRGLLSVSVVAILLLALPLFYWVGARQSYLNQKSATYRSAFLEDWSARGTLISADDQVLAESVKDSQTGKVKRSYPLGAAAAQTIGYLSHQYGKSGLEKGCDEWLSSARGSSAGLLEQLQRLSGLPVPGHKVQVTLNAKLQKTAYEALGGRRGAVAVINPQTGAILALASSPSYDANKVDALFDELRTHPHAALLNRATQGLYPPGSTFKIFTAAAALDTGVVTPDTTFDCEGTWQGPGTRIKCLKRSGHGEISLFDGIRLSCNIALSQTALKLGLDGFYSYAKAFHLEDPFELPCASSKGMLPDRLKATEADLAEMGFGQGRLLVSPLWIALMAGTVTNNGQMMRPYLISKITGQNGKMISETSPLSWGQPVSSQAASEITRMMVATVDTGTGTVARLPGVEVAGKTGTAENPEGRPHGWFVATAPAGRPVVAVAAIVENSGTGSANAGPIVKQILRQALKQAGELD